MRKKLLVVDDEFDIVNMLRDYFEMSGYDVLTALSGAEALEKLRLQPDMILLDINMPDMDGLEVCKRIRNHVSCPILFLTARVDDTDKITGFRVGGDDYVVKPFSLDELGARVEAHLRRDDRQASRSRMRFEDDLVIDYSERAVYYKQQQIPLAKKEFDIIEFLSLNSGQVFDRERIYERLWSWDSDGDSAVVAEHIRRIRAKLSGAGSRTHIETVWGVGYKWVK